MEIVENDNAHSWSESDVPEVSKESDGIFKGDKPMDTNEASKNDSIIEPAFSVYEEIKGVPYTIQYLDMNAALFNDKTLLKDGETIKMARYIDSFVSDEIDRKHLIDSLDSYQDIINNLKNIAGIDTNETSVSVLDKLYKFIKSYRGVSAYGL